MNRWLYRIYIKASWGIPRWSDLPIVGIDALEQMHRKTLARESASDPEFVLHREVVSPGLSCCIYTRCIAVRVTILRFWQDVNSYRPAIFLIVFCNAFIDEYAFKARWSACQQKRSPSTKRTRFNQHRSLGDQLFWFAPSCFSRAFLTKIYRTADRQSVCLQKNSVSFFFDERQGGCALGHFERFLFDLPFILPGQRRLLKFVVGHVGISLYCVFSRPTCSVVTTK